MLRQLFKFSLTLLLCAAVSYLLHFYLFTSFFPEGSEEFINFSYKFNFGITFLFTSTIILASQLLKDQLGFIFLGSSFVKIAIFLLLVKTSDFEIDKADFLHFFVPYFLCMVLEIIQVSRLLKDANFNKDK